MTLWQHQKDENQSSIFSIYQDQSPSLRLKLDSADSILDKKMHEQK